MSERVRQYYDRTFLREWSRLERHPLEYATTLRAMRTYLPPAGCVLDIGGGPGRYSLELARAGFRVTLVDLSGESIAFALRQAAQREIPLQAFTADAVDLGDLDDLQFDAVLLMGPLYHLLEQRLRDRAIREALRVLRPGGVLVASFINRLAFLVDTLAKDPEALREIPVSHLQAWLADGPHPDPNCTGFTDHHAIHPHEIEPLMLKHGVACLRLMAVDGLDFLAGFYSTEPESGARVASPELLERLTNLQYDLGVDPTMWGYSLHMLYLGRKPEVGSTE